MIRPRRFHANLALKIVIPVLSILVLTTLASYAFFTWRLKAQGEADLRARLESFASGKAAELTEPLWNFQDDVVERLLRSYQDNEDLLRLSLYDRQGKLLLQVQGTPPQRHSRTLRAERILFHHMAPGTCASGGWRWRITTAAWSGPWPSAGPRTR